ncbi:hypothetical protein Micbo1qcDRAFT_181505 [Microdochium bolleyi]|uniref:Chromo domain-containing protein n=1 Tax=Microdochium bolleyi TaxID=196109 RepID=A0A136IHY7_9PEZI|nr:hypothetical protein Micbo1qcDRAFT_181505 [Microdochium bolleyi]
MESSNGQQCNSLNASVQTAHIHGIRSGIDQSIQDDPCAKRERDGLGTDQPRSRTPAPSFLTRDGERRNRDRSQTEKRTQTALSQLPSNIPCDIKREGSPMVAELGDIKTLKVEPASGVLSLTPVLAGPALVPSATCLNGSTKERHKRCWAEFEDSEFLPDARRRKREPVPFKSPVMVPCDQSYTLKEFRCQKDPDTGYITVIVSWEESVVPISAFPLDGTWQELEKHLQGDYHELCQQNGDYGDCADVSDIVGYMVSDIRVGMFNGQLEITVVWADTVEPLSVLDSDARETAKKQIIKNYGRKVWNSESKRAGLEA